MKDSARAAVGGIRGAPWWMAPAILVGRLRPSLGASANADELAFRGWPAVVVSWILPGVAILLALVPSIIHALATQQLTDYTVNWSRIGIVDMYTESFAVMAGALVLGVLSPALGVFFLLVFAIFDLTAASLQPHELAPIPDAVVGRLVSYWLLWLLAVEVPLFGRSLATSEGGHVARRLQAAAIGAAVTGGFALLWTYMAPSLIRAPFVMSHLYGPQVSAIYPLQQGGWQIALVGAIAAALLIAIRGSDRLIGDAPAPVRGWDRREVVAVRHVLVAAALTVCLRGIIGAPWHAALLFGTLVVARPVATLVAGRTPLARLAHRLPPAGIVAASVLIAMVIALAIVPWTPDSFDRVVLGVVVIVFVVELVSATPMRAARAPAPAPSPAVAAMLLAMGLLALTFAMPLAVLADNCADAGDCYAGWPGAALAAGATGAYLAARHLRNAREKPPPTPAEPPLVPFEPFIDPDDYVAFVQDSFSRRPMPDEGNWKVVQPPPSGCVLTTACMIAFGKPDDCHELQRFRQLRDEYLRRESSGPEVIKDYYRTSPLVVAAIISSPDQPDAWRQIYAEFVEPVVALVDAGRFQEASDLALARYDAIKERYGVD